MAQPLVSDALWQRLQPLLPEPKPRRARFPGRKPLPLRDVLSGILFVLKTGIAWDDLPAELGWGCGKTCRAALRLWHRLGIWAALHRLLLAELRGADRLDWSRAPIDAAFAKAPLGGAATGPNPTGRGKSGTKHHLVTDAQGVPLAATTTAANVNEVTMLLPLVDAIPPVAGKVGRPRRRPDRVQGDRGYDAEGNREGLRGRGIEPVLAERNTGHGSGLGVFRWFVERTLSWLHRKGRLRLRWDRLPEVHDAFLQLTCSLICVNYIQAFGLA
jgi:transposase